MDGEEIKRLRALVRERECHPRTSRANAKTYFPLSFKRPMSWAPDKSPTFTFNNRRSGTSRASFHGSTPRPSLMFTLDRSRFAASGSFASIPAQPEGGFADEWGNASCFGLRGRGRPVLVLRRLRFRLRLQPVCLMRSRSRWEVKTFFGYGCSFSTSSDLISLPTTTIAYSMGVYNDLFLTYCCS